jgi:RNA-directed DNA polymerase
MCPTGVGPARRLSSAVSNEAVKQIRSQIKRWRLQLRGGLSMQDLAVRINPIVRGWINYCVSRGHARWDRRAVGSMI